MREVRILGIRRSLVLAGVAISQVSWLSSAGQASADVVLAPFSIENGSLYYNYSGNGFGDSGYTPLSSTDLKASNSYSSLATHSYSSYRVFAINFDLSQISSSAAVKSATLSVDETVSTYPAKLRLYATTQPVGVGTFNLAPFNDRTIGIQAATPASFDLTSLVQGALNSGANHLTIGARNSGGTKAFLGITWFSSVATWSNPQLAIVVPEPSTWAMLGSGAGFVLLVARRRRQRVEGMAKV